MAVKSEEFDGVCVLSIPSRFAGDDANAAMKAAEEYMKTRQVYDFVADLSQTQFIDSAGLEALLWIKKQAAERLGRFKLASLCENVGTILHLTRLTPQFELAADVSSALKILR